MLAGVPIVKVSSGNNHLALLAQDGRVFTCGCGESGQLGRIAEVFATRSSRNRNGIGECLNAICSLRHMTCGWNVCFSEGILRTGMKGECFDVSISLKHGN